MQVHYLNLPLPPPTCFPHTHTFLSILAVLIRMFVMRLVKSHLSSYWTHFLASNKLSVLGSLPVNLAREVTMSEWNNLIKNISYIYIYIKYLKLLIRIYVGSCCEPNNRECFGYLRCIETLALSTLTRAMPLTWL